jgi:molybdate transport system substrate-binding protein
MKFNRKDELMKWLRLSGFICAMIIISCKQSSKLTSEPLLCYVGGTMRPAVERLADDYYKKYGKKILIDYSSSGEALIKAKQTGKGDLIVVHDPYAGAIKKEGMGDKFWSVATLSPVIVVPKGNPKKIRNLKDLAQNDMKLILSDPHYSTLGHIVGKMAGKAGIAEKLDSLVVTRTKGSAGAADAVALGTADAGIVWNAVAFLRADKIDTVSVEPHFLPDRNIDAISSATFGDIDISVTNISVVTLTGSKQLDEARKFAEFLCSNDAEKVWIELGYGKKITQITQNNTILIHCAAGMRSPIEKISSLFEQFTGDDIVLNYDGSNRLLGAIELSGKGDVYITGDADYLDIASQKNLIEQKDTICYFEPVIMVKKGNPKHIRSLVDMVNQDLKIAQGDERSAAVGRLTPRLLDINKIIINEWEKRVVLKTPTVNELAIAVKLGTVDATIVWATIANDYADVADIIEIPEKSNIFPAVGAAVLKCSVNKSSAEKFLNFLSGPNGQNVLIAQGYLVKKL